MFNRKDTVNKCNNQNRKAPKVVILTQKFLIIYLEVKKASNLKIQLIK